MLKQQFIDLVDYAHSIYRLKDLIRFNDSLRIRNEDVSQHTAQVSILVLKLYEIYAFRLTRALEMAILHDLHEIELGEFTKHTKDTYPKIKKASDASEIIAASKVMSKSQVRIHREFMRGNNKEARVVLLADVMSCLQYVDSEITLGNTGYLSQIRDDILDRIVKCMNNMKYMERR